MTQQEAALRVAVQSALGIVNDELPLDFAGNEAIAFKQVLHELLTYETSW